MRIIRHPQIKIYPDRGKHCFIGRIGNDVYRIFDILPVSDLTDEVADKEFHWGDYPSEFKPYRGWSGLKEATIIQNICWLHGLAPRVYEIVGLEMESGKYFAQRIEDLTGQPFCDEHNDAFPTYEKVKELGEIYGWHTEKDDVSRRDVMGGKLVDFNTFHFTEDHREKVMAIIRDKGHYGKTIYQDEPKLDIISTPRKTQHRIEAMKLDKIDFKGKSVLDLGCATGGFCRYASDRGAGAVLGIDFEDVVGTDTREAAYLVAWELGYFDIEFEQMDLRVEKPPKADIVFFLSLDYHIGLPDWLAEVTNEVCVFELNTRGFNKDINIEKGTENKLRVMFRKIKLVGRAEDQGNCQKPIYHCFK